MPATNNVIWRLVTGKRTSQDDPELKHFTGMIQKNFQFYDPSSVFALIQINSLPFTKLLQKLNLPNFFDSANRIFDMLIGEIESTKALDGGNYIERALHEGTTDDTSIFTQLSAIARKSFDMVMKEALSSFGII